jgi:hypothetical protein
MRTCEGLELVLRILMGYRQTLLNQSTILTALKLITNLAYAGAIILSPVGVIILIFELTFIIVIMILSGCA